MTSIRLIKDDEIKAGAMLLAESFVKYPLMITIFPDDEKRLKQSFYFFWFYVYTRKNFTYVSEDMNMLVSLIKPGDKEISCIPLVFTPGFAFGVLREIPLIKTIPKVVDYLNRMSGLAKKYYNPKTDLYVEMMAIRESKRGLKYMHETIQSLDDGSPVYCETLLYKNVRGYSFLGFELLEEMEWRGTKIYAMKRKAKKLVER